jgi:mono/diheme cytochrome c family protein
MKTLTILLAAASLGIGATLAYADDKRDAILADLLTQAKTADAAFAGFSADRGKAFFLATQVGGKPDTASCTACHTKDPKAKGQSRAGKEIAPMAVSKTPDRFTDAEKVAKWFLRNCTSVLGRECSAAEKGDFIAYMASL